MGVTERKMNRLINLLREKKYVKKLEMMELLDIKERSIKYYIQKLRSKGLDLVSSKDGYTVKGDISSGNITDKKEHRLMTILQEVTSGSKKLTRKELVDSVFKKITLEESISRKTIDRAVLEAYTEGYLIRDKDGLISAASDVPVLFETSEENVLRFLEKSDYLKGRIPLGEVIEDIKVKIEKTTSLTIDDTTIKVIGRDYKIGKKLLDYLKELENLNYQNQCIHIRYHTRQEILSLNLEVVTIYFATEDDQVYLIAYPKDGIKENPYFYLIDSILEMSENNSTNTRYQDRTVIMKLEGMIGASLDGPYDVKIRFDDVHNIKEKLHRFVESRSTATLTMNGDLYLEDRIYGLADFARFLRGFGTFCEVITPEELRDKMRDSYVRMLKRYGEIDES